MLIPTTVLSEEHLVILKVLDCLEKIVEEGEQNNQLNKESATNAVTFIREFADKCHHAKEEDRLFVVMEANGFPREGGPIGCMLHEHEEGRNHVKEMFSSLEKASNGDSSALATFKNHGNGFIELLRAHINKEDNILFPMANQGLESSHMQTLRDDFQKIEAEAGNRHAKYIEMARKLCEQYEVSFVETSKIQTLLSEYGVTISPTN